MDIGNHGDRRDSAAPAQGRAPAPRALRVLAAAVASLAALALSSCSPDESEAGPDTYSGYVADPPVDVSEVVLTTTDGDNFDMAAEPGGINLVYFGYTYCPDVCPTTMSAVRTALEELPGEEADGVQVAMVTIDPDRDTPEVIDGYVTNFVDDGIALRTEDRELLRSAADAFGADYEVTMNDDGEVEVSHTGDLYAVDDTGTLVMQWPFGTDRESISRDLRSLISTTRG